MEKVRLYPERVLAMVALVENMNISTVKTKPTVCVYPVPVKEVVDLCDDEGSCKTKSNVRGVLEERSAEGGPVSIANKSKRSVSVGFGVAGVGADDERGNPEEVGLECVGGRDEDVLMDVGLERDHRRENRGGVDEFRVSLKI
jgi:hypothetical protein